MTVEQKITVKMWNVVLRFVYNIPIEQDDSVFTVNAVKHETRLFYEN